MPEITISEVRSESDAMAAAELVWAFFDYLRVEFPEEREQIDEYLKVQDVRGELERMTEHFTPPKGECLLARLDGRPVGVLMLKHVSGDLCELNRMFVRDEARGLGIARKLCERLMDAGRAMNFSQIRLEALNDRIPAVPLYRKLGFLPDPEPTDYAKANPRVVSMRRPL